METGNYGVSAYQGRMAVEVLTCVNNLQSRCDMPEDSTGILGCAACCSGLENTSNGLLLENHLQENYPHTGPLSSVTLRDNCPYTDLLASAVGGQHFIGESHSSQIDRNNPFLVSSVINRQIASAFYEKRSRKRPAGSPEEENAKKKGRVNQLDNSSQPSRNNLGVGFTLCGEPQGDKEKAKAAKLRKGKDPLIAVKPEVEMHLSKAQEPKVEDEEADAEAEAAAVEWKRCVSLMKSYGIIASPDLLSAEVVPHCVAHPGCVGDGLLPKMCKICGTVEDANNTVICDDCQEAFHLSCCVPRLTSKYFKREDSWFCSSCRKHRRKVGSKVTEKGPSQEDNKTKVSAANNESKARLGPAHQADVPEWQNRAQDDDAERCVEGYIGMEVPFTEEQKDAEKDRLINFFDSKLESLAWLPAEKVPHGTVQNWLKCKTVIARERKDSEGRKQSEIVCGKWRRAPLNVEQTDEWECFCSMEWDPLHADCAIPQECSDEEVLKRLSYRMQTNTEGQGYEPGSRKATLRQGKLV